MGGFSASACPCCFGYPALGVLGSAWTEAVTRTNGAAQAPQMAAAASARRHGVPRAALAGGCLALFAYSLIEPDISALALGFGGALVSITVDQGAVYLLFVEQRRRRLRLRCAWHGRRTTR
jgi:hypothetical protein